MLSYLAEPAVERLVDADLGEHDVSRHVMKAAFAGLNKLADEEESQSEVHSARYVQYFCNG